uniref:Ran-binding protein 3 n=1 Tax=Cacopsylla melanoneura TaxID=428564 RepID=A0A8D8Y9C8_9HEMI
MSQNPSETFEEPDSMSDQKCSQVTSPDSSDSVTTDMPQSSVSSASENNTTCSPHSSSDSRKPNSTSSNETPSTSVLTSQNCSVLRKSFLNQVSNSASTSENVVSTTPKFQFKSSSFGSSLLKPSALSCSKASGSGSSGGFALKAPTLKNPFFKNVNIPEVSNSTVDENKTSNENSQEVTSSGQVSESPPTTAAASIRSPASTQENPSSSSSSTSLSSGLRSPPKFVPTLSNTSSTSNAATGGFVFGQNLRNRVTAQEDQSSSPSEASSSNNTDSATASGTTSTTTSTGEDFNSFASTNGTTDMLFTSTLQKESGEAKMDSGGEDSGTTRHKSLSEAAREYEEARANKRKYEAVATVTGEEEEVNILQINCKLFLYDKVKTWIELGRGHLRLNDINHSLSRIVIRVVGSLRVILNTKIWPEMVVQKPSENSVRLTAKENGQVKIYLVKASSKEIDQLYKALEWRVNNQKKMCAENGYHGNGTDESNESSESKKLMTEELVVTNGTREPDATPVSATQPQHSV